MAVSKGVPADDAIALIRDRAMLGCSGYVGTGVHEQLLDSGARRGERALERTGALVHHKPLMRR